MTFLGRKFSVPPSIELPDPIPLDYVLFGLGFCLGFAAGLNDTPSLLDDLRMPAGVRFMIRAASSTDKPASESSITRRSYA
jgi:hypothetical protein